MAQKIYVGNLPYDTDESAVQQLFATHGDMISVALPTDRETGRPRGFGFVEMSSEHAASAIATLKAPTSAGAPSTSTRHGLGARVVAAAAAATTAASVRVS